MRHILESTATVLVLAAASRALAQQAEGDMETAPSGTVLAPKHALEIGVNGGYSQPFGKLTNNVNATDVAHAGGGMGLDIGYRATPIFGIGGFGEFHMNATDSSLGEGSTVSGLAAGIVASFHFLPYKLVDPYATLGGGYRALRVSTVAGDNHLFHGIEGARVRAGVDFRVDKDVAFGPLVGADVNIFLADHNEATGATNNISNKGANTFIYAGLGGRFDLAGQRVPAYAPTPAAAPPIAREVQPAEPTPAPAPAEPPSTGVSIDADILAQCHLTNGKAFFEFDKSNLSACDLTTINAIAACLSTGPLKGKKLEIIGHADPRGSDEYNLKLGESRAASVAGYLENAGVPKDGLVTSSKGKSEATGVDENGWAYDRRVEIHLMK